MCRGGVEAHCATSLLHCPGPTPGCPAPTPRKTTRLAAACPVQPRSTVGPARCWRDAAPLAALARLLAHVLTAHPNLHPSRPSRVGGGRGTVLLVALRPHLVVRPTISCRLQSMRQRIRPVTSPGQRTLLHSIRSFWPCCPCLGVSPTFSLIFLRQAQGGTALRARPCSAAVHRRACACALVPLSSAYLALTCSHQFRVTAFRCPL